MYGKRVVIPLNGLTLSHICACLKPRLGFPTSHVIVCSVSLVRLIIVHFDDIGGIDVQHKKHTLCKGPAKEYFAC